MIKIEVTGVRVTSGAKPYRIVEAYAATLDPTGQPHKYPQKVSWFLRDKEDAPAPGNYLLAPASLYADAKGRLSVAPKLVPAAGR